MYFQAQIMFSWPQATHVRLCVCVCVWVWVCVCASQYTGLVYGAMTWAQHIRAYRRTCMHTCIRTVIGCVYTFITYGMADENDACMYILYMFIYKYMEGVDETDIRNAYICM